MIVHDAGRWLAFSKPPGLSLQTPRSRPGEAVARLVAGVPRKERERHGLDPAGLWLVHRLDVGTSGLVLLARDEEMHSALAEAFARRRVGKTYLALVWGRPRGREGLFDPPLGPDRADRRRMRVDPEGRPARTRWRVLASPRHASLLELQPETGRTHQIRVHLAHAGHPVVGDDLYGGPRHRGVKDPVLRDALSPSHTLLHAWKLHLPPLLGEDEVILKAPLPATFGTALVALGVDTPG